MALPLNSLFAPTTGWTAQAGEGGNQSLTGHAAPAPVSHIDPTDVTFNADLVAALEAAGLMASS